jgi:hypothetical protein
MKYPFVDNKNVSHCLRTRNEKFGVVLLTNYCIQAFVIRIVFTPATLLFVACNYTLRINFIPYAHCVQTHVQCQVQWFNIFKYKVSVKPAFLLSTPPCSYLRFFVKCTYHTVSSVYLIRPDVGNKTQCAEYTVRQKFLQNNWQDAE